MRARSRDRGVLVRSSPYSETSLLLRAFTLQHGMSSILAKGIRKKRKLDLLTALSEYEFLLYEPSEGGLFVLGDLSLLQGFDFSADPLKWAAAECGPELYAQLMIPLEETPAYYKLLLDYLDYLARMQGSPLLIWWRFQLRVVALLGIPCQDNYRSWENPGGVQYLREPLCPLAEDILRLLPSIGGYLDTIFPDAVAASQLNRLFADYYLQHFNRKLELRSLQVLQQFLT